jgi:hypothetical protein
MVGSINIHPTHLFRSEEKNFPVSASSDIQLKTKTSIDLKKIDLPKNLRSFTNL